MFGGPPYGVPIPEELHEQYAPEVKTAWETFDAWYKEACADSNGDLIDRSTMPIDVKEAMDLILETPIPGYDESVTGADSCYMQGVFGRLKDHEPV